MSLSKSALMEYGPTAEGDYTDYPEAWRPEPPKVEAEPEIVAVVQKDSSPLRITNKFNLPQPLVEAVSNNKYSPGKSDYTTTQLAGTPARQFVLKKRHWNEISEDVSDLIYSLSGQSKHVVLERAAEFCKEYHYLAEERFYITREGKKIGGQIDLYDEEKRILYDWKETGVYASYHDVKPEWVAQGNVNKLLLEENGYSVDHIINIALYRDWKKSEVGRTKDYPPHQVEQFPIEVWTREQTESFITRRIAEFEAAKVELPECTPEERWQTKDLWAMTKKGNKRATKLFDTQAEAESHIEIFKLKGYEVAFRPGVNKRCESYCAAMPFCSQYKQLKENEDAANRNIEAA